jgi:hypothetical protein
LPSIAAPPWCRRTEALSAGGEPAPDKFTS